MLPAMRFTCHSNYIYIYIYIYIYTNPKPPITTKLNNTPLKGLTMSHMV